MTPTIPILPKPPRKHRHIQLDYPVDALLVQLAAQVDTSASQLANMLLAYGLLAYLDDEALSQTVEARRSRARSMKFLWDLILPEDWLARIEASLNQEATP